MSKIIKIWERKSPNSFNHVFFRWGDARKWRHHQNWKFNWSRTGSPEKIFFCTIITPFFRFVVCNGQTQLGLGNHFFIFGYSPSR